MELTTPVPSPPERRETRDGGRGRGGGGHAKFAPVSPSPAFGAPLWKKPDSPVYLLAPAWLSVGPLHASHAGTMHFTYAGEVWGEEHFRYIPFLSFC